MVESTRIEPAKFFETPIYIEHRPEFLDKVAPIGQMGIDLVKSSPDFEIDPIYPVIQSGPLNHPDMFDFIQYITQLAWNILNDQGYAMEKYNTFVSEVWSQQIEKHGQQFEHIHGAGSQISGFYFTSVPANSSYPRFKDPRPGKRQLELPLKNHHVMSMGKSDVMLGVQAGDIVMTNSWLEHSFVPNKSDEPFEFIHFNIITSPAVRNTSSRIVSAPQSPQNTNTEVI